MLYSGWLMQCGISCLSKGVVFQSSKRSVRAFLSVEGDGLSDRGLSCCTPAISPHILMESMPGSGKGVPS